MADPLVEKRYSIYEGRTHLEMIPVPDIFLDGDYNTNTELFLEFMDDFFKFTFGAIRKEGLVVTLIGNDIVISQGEMWWGKFVVRTPGNVQIVDGIVSGGVIDGFSASRDADIDAQYVYVRIKYKRWTLEDDTVPITDPNNVFIRQEVNGVELSRPNQYIYSVDFLTTETDLANSRSQDGSGEGDISSEGRAADDLDTETFILKLATISASGNVTMNMRMFGNVLSDLDFDSEGLPSQISANTTNIQALFALDAFNAKLNTNNHFLKSNSNEFSVATFDNVNQQVVWGETNIATLNVSGTLEVLTLSSKTAGTRMVLKLVGGGIMRFVNSANLLLPGGVDLLISAPNWVEFLCVGNNLWELISNSSANTVLLRNQGGVPIGSIVGYEGSVSQFDGTGLGFGGLTGWAICNGSNGTGDMRGRNLTGFGDDPAWADNFDQMGESGGAISRIIGINNLPTFTPSGTLSSNGDHNHADQMRSGTMMGDSNSQAGGEGNDDNLKITDSPSNNSTLTGEHTHTFTGNQIGGDEPISILSPYYVAMWIKRVS